MKSIGGSIELDSNWLLNNKFFFLNSFNVEKVPYSYINSGRSALFHILEKVKKKNSILYCPEYICLKTFNSVFKKVKVKILFYEVDLNLKVKKKKII